MTESVRDKEAEIIHTLALLRERSRLSYQQLSDLMKAEGCNIHPSGIQKTEKSGRRLTVNELLAYSKALGVTVEELIEGGPPAESRSEMKFRAARTIESLQESIAALEKLSDL